MIVCVCVHLCVYACVLLEASTAGTQLLQDIAGLLIRCWLIGSFFFSPSLPPLSIHSGKLLKEDGASKCCILFKKGKGGGGMKEKAAMQDPGGAKHAGEARNWATVPLRDTTVRKLETRKEEEGREGRRGEGRSEVKGTSGECGNFLCWQCSTHPQWKYKQEKLQMFQDDVRWRMWRWPLVQFAITLLRLRCPAVGRDPEAREMLCFTKSRLTQGRLFKVLAQLPEVNSADQVCTQSN